MAAAGVDGAGTRGGWLLVGFKVAGLQDGRALRSSRRTRCP